MADFRITDTVWLHHKPWKPGQEDALTEAGFTAEQKREQARRGAIVWTEPVNASKNARALAEEHGIDLGSIIGSGTDGKVTAPDVQEILDARSDLESDVGESDE